MKLSKFIFMALIGFLILPPTAFGDDDVASRWNAAPVSIDGNSAEWAPDEITAEASAGAKIAFRNDALRLYVLLVLDNPEFQSTVEQTGVTLWINSAMKTKKIHGIKFSKKMVSAEELIQRLKDEGQDVSAEKEAEFKSKPQYLLFACDTVNKKGEVVPHSGPAGVGAYRNAHTEKILSYEFAIPLTLLADPDNKIKVDPAKPFKFGVEWGGVTEEMLAMRRAQFEGQAGNPDSGNGEFSPEDYLQAGRNGPKAYSFWIDLKLAPEK